MYETIEQILKCKERSFPKLFFRTFPIIYLSNIIAFCALIFFFTICNSMALNILVFPGDKVC